VKEDDMKVRLMTTALALLAVAGLAGCSKKTEAPMADTTTQTPSPPGSALVTNRDYKWNQSVMPSPAPSSTPLYRMNEIAFVQGSTSYGAEGSGVCRDTGKLLLERNVKKVLLVSYGDKSEAGNSSLMMQRNDVIRRCLVQQGLAPEIFEMTTYGSQFATADKLEPQKMEQERRVEIWVLSE
jgi:outer membrane protein OmpA-like peptidoglycan-associated protein